MKYDTLIMVFLIAEWENYHKRSTFPFVSSNLDYLETAEMT